MEKDICPECRYKMKWLKTYVRCNYVLMKDSWFWMAIVALLILISCGEVLLFHTPDIKVSGYWRVQFILGPYVIIMPSIGFILAFFAFPQKHHFKNIMLWNCNKCGIIIKENKPNDKNEKWRRL